MEAVGGEFGRRDIVPDVARLGGLGEQISDEPVDLLLASCSVFAPMEELGEFGVAPGLVGVEGVCLENRLEPFTRLEGVVSDLDQVLEMAADVTVVPGVKDRLDLGEVLVEGGTTDPRLLGGGVHSNVLCNRRCGPITDSVNELAGSVIAWPSFTSGIARTCRPIC